MYRRVFFPIIVMTFLLAGVNLPVASVLTSVRWVILGLGASVGAILVLKDRHYHFGSFHVLALFAVLTSLVSAAVSRYTSLSLLKVLSLLLLFVYAGTGARVAVKGRENRFFEGLLTGCEVFVGAVATCYLVGIEVMGNPNSLGAVMGVVGAPILLWGTLVSVQPFVRGRRLALCTIAMYLTFASHARASMAAALLSCGLLCLALRRYRLFMLGVVTIVIFVTAAAILRPEAFSRTVSSLTSTLVYKGMDPALGVLGSRKSPWQDAVDSIRNHFWFGTGFGTSDNGRDLAKDAVGNFSTVSAASGEHGSSYLAITTWVGIAGLLPFLMLLFALLRRVVQTVVWMFRSRNPLHPAVPLAMVMVAGLVHASLEDWLFAPGYYLCVFYWSMAFVFVDQAPAQPNFRRAPFWRAGTMTQRLGQIVPNR